jgi:hypothetical protein
VLQSLESQRAGWWREPGAEVGEVEQLQGWYQGGTIADECAAKTLEMMYRTTPAKDDGAGIDTVWKQVAYCSITYCSITYCNITSYWVSTAMKVVSQSLEETAPCCD